MPKKLHFPTLDKIAAVKPQSQAIGEFLEWLQCKKKFEICERVDGQRFPVTINTEKLLAEFFKIDLQKADDERRKILNVFRV